MLVTRNVHVNFLYVVIILTETMIVVLWASTVTAAIKTKVLLASVLYVNMFVYFITFMRWISYRYVSSQSYSVLLLDVCLVLILLHAKRENVEEMPRTQGFSTQGSYNARFWSD